MSADISVIMPAWRAEATVAAAAASALAGQEVSVELVLCADDDVEYGSILREAGLSLGQVTLCRTPEPRSGPSTARNIAAEAASAPVLAALDADDAYAPGRLRRVLEAMERCGLGAGTGPTLEGPRNGPAQRVAAAAGETLTLGEICGLRMPFSPVFERHLAPGWPPVGFAEDMLLNAHLHSVAGGYAFSPEAGYRYHVEPSSMVQDAASLSRAMAGYRQILDWLPGSWIAPGVRDEIAQVIGEDLATARAALEAGAPSWRAAFSRTDLVDSDEQ